VHATVTTDPETAAAALADGHLAVIPTETVYGLGARANEPAAIARVYAVKGRPTDHPLIVHVVDADAAWQWARHVPDYARALAEHAWPGPLTLVLRRSDRAHDDVTGGQDSVAIRVPAHPMTQAVLRALAARCGDPAIGIAAPSANRFGRVSPTSAGHALDELDEALIPGDVVLDGGPCTVGLESTIIDATGDEPRILRPGSVAASDVMAITRVGLGTESTVRAPGTLAAHYAPRARVHVIPASESFALDPHDPRWATSNGQVGLIALAHIDTPPGWLRLCAPSDASEYARSLYAALREADRRSLVTVVAVAPPPGGIADAIRDRLTRAAYQAGDQS
jgi:L-threonylcarbamoyladenylate synthase